MIKYKARVNNKWGVVAFIELVKIERETEASVWVNGTRSAKRSEYANYYDTWKEARAALLNCQWNRCNSLRMQLENADTILSDIKEMKNE